MGVMEYAHELERNKHAVVKPTIGGLHTVAFVL